MVQSSSIQYTAASEQTVWVLSLQNRFTSFLEIYKYNEDIVSIFVDCLVLLVSVSRDI